jgi:hypothetical protein
MKFCFFKQLASALGETMSVTMSVARPHLGKPESLLIGLPKSSLLIFFSTRTKKQWKKVVSFFGHEVLFF